MVEFLKYLLIGFIQGITEVFPVSSSGHLKIAKAILHLDYNEIALDVFLHLASLIAVMLFLYKPLKKVIKGSFLYLFKKQKEYKTEAKYLLFLIISTIPVVIFTIIIKLLGYDTSPVYIVGLCLVINGLMLLITKIKKLAKHKNIKDLKIKDALTIGLCQCLGIFPGISRSGSCLTGTSIVGLEKDDAANYVFMLFIPAVLGAFVLEFKDITTIFSLEEKMFPLMLGAFIVAGAVTYLAFKWLLKLIKKDKLQYFAGYCIIIGIATFIYSACNGWL